jgi:glycosyltransferase involved in cell wall biosynthesis
MNEPEVSVVIGTYNRCDVLRGALESLLTQDSGGVNYEVIVVDNNSTDDTRNMVAGLREKLQTTNLIYCFERTQGVSHARNRGITAARGRLIAFTDDDIRPAPNWIATVREGFRKFPNADCIGGRVLPQPQTEFPVWLTSKHWSPLALLDMGDKPIDLDVRNGPGLVAANLAVKASVFADVGLFQPQLQRVKNSIGSMEDHEFQLRLTAANKRLVYLPDLVVYAQVLEERLTKDYHRRWYRGHGYFYALMRAADFEASKMRLLDVPAHVYRRALSDVYLWMKYRLQNQPEMEFHHEVELSFFWGFFRKRLADRRSPHKSTKGTNDENGET